MKALISFWCFDGVPVLWGKLMQNDHIFTYNQYSCMTVGIYFLFQHSVKLNDMWIFFKRIILKSRGGKSIFSRRLSHLVITALASQQRKIPMCLTTHAPFSLSLTCCIWINQILGILLKKRKTNYWFCVDVFCGTLSISVALSALRFLYQYDRSKSCSRLTLAFSVTERRIMERNKNAFDRNTN